MMIKREWRQLLEMIKFSLGKGKAPELRVETDWGKFYRICNRIRSMCGLTEYANFIRFSLWYAPEYRSFQKNSSLRKKY